MLFLKHLGEKRGFRLGLHLNYDLYQGSNRVGGQRPKEGPFFAESDKFFSAKGTEKLEKSVKDTHFWCRMRRKF